MYCHKYLYLCIKLSGHDEGAGEKWKKGLNFLTIVVQRCINGFEGTARENLAYSAFCMEVPDVVGTAKLTTSVYGQMHIKNNALIPMGNNYSFHKGT